MRRRPLNHSIWHRRWHLAKGTVMVRRHQEALLQTWCRGAAGRCLWPVVCPITVSQVQCQNPSTKEPLTPGTRSFVLKNNLLLQSTTRKHSCHGPQTQESEKDTEICSSKETRKQGRKNKTKTNKQQYIKCFFFNETNPKDVQSGSSCAVHKHGENKQTEGQSSDSMS